MDDVASLMKEIAVALPENSIREVCLYYRDGDHEYEWEVLAGGHQSVNLGEWCGNFSAKGSTADDALKGCLRNIKENLDWRAVRGLAKGQ